MIDIFNGININEELGDILNSVNHSNLVINAYAGSGKTTTLKLIADNNPKKKILYLVFNKAMENEAKSKFGKNVHVTTVHSLAYRHMSYKLNIKNNLGNISIYDIKNYLDLDYFEAKITWLLFNIYLQSDILDLDQVDDLVNECIKDKRIWHAFLYSKFSDVLIQNVVNIPSLIYKYVISNNLISNVKSIWSAVGKGLPITHDYYLKAFQLDLVSGNKKVKNYDYIFLDEAQDSNGVTYSIFNNISNSSRKIAVGDEFQNIYGFRGSINIMERLEKFDNFSKKYLSTSYRFTDDIASILNEKIMKYTGIKTNIKGLGKPSESVSFAYISRSNASLIPLMDRLDSFHITRDINDIFDLPINIYYLSRNEKDKIKESYSFLKSVNSLEDLENIAQKVNDVELLSAIKMVKRYNGGLFKLLNDVKSKMNENSNYVLTTAHSSKGLEYDSVTLLNDFPVLRDMKDDVFYRDEFNLYYVALSRAKYEVIDNTEN